MNFDLPQQAPQGPTPEQLREELRQQVEKLNAIQSAYLGLGIDDMPMTHEEANAKAALISEIFASSEKHPEALLEVVAGVRDPRTRADLWRKAIVSLGAKGASKAFETALEAFKDAGHETRESNSLRIDAAMARVQALMSEDLAEAGRALLSLEQEYKFDSRFQSLWGKLRDEMRMEARRSADDGIPAVAAFLHGLPDRFPALDGERVKQYENAHLSVYMGRVMRGIGPLEEGDVVPTPSIASARLTPEDKRALEGLLKDEPEILAAGATARDARTDWTDEERLGLFKRIRDEGAHASALASYGPDDVPSERFPEIRKDLFEAYRKDDPLKLLGWIDRFQDEFRALPKEERDALIRTWLHGDDGTLVWLLERAASGHVELDEGQKESFLLMRPGTLKDKDMLGKLDLDAGTFLSRLAAERPDDFYAKFPDAAMTVRIDPDAAQQGMEKMLTGGMFRYVSSFERASGAHFDFTRASTAALGGIPLSALADFAEDKPDAKARLAWADMLPKLEKIQGRAKREEHDPWKRELDPLAVDAFKRSLLSPESAEDAGLFLEFVKEFGAANTPRLLEAFVGLKRAKSIEEIPEDVRRMLEETLGKRRVEKMKRPADLLNELRKFDRGMVGALLKDEVPQGISSELGAELFEAKIGSSNWEQSDDPKELIARWETFRRNHPEAAKAPEGYEETKLEVPLAGRGPAKEVKEILERTGAVEACKRIQGAFRAVMPDEFEYQAYPLVEIMPEVFRENVGHPASIDVGRLSPFDVSPLEEVARLGEEADEALRALSAGHAFMSAPEGFEDMIYALSARDVDHRSVAEFRKLLVDYLSEHYLHPSQEAHRTGHAPFSPELRSKLEKLWGLDDKANNPIIKAFNETEALKKNRKASEKTKEIALVPAQGLLRVYVGDLADACYTNRHRELADGRYPDLHAMIFVTGRGTAKEAFAGSALFIETETPDGKKVLMVRANNPRENLIQQVDADALVRQTLDAAIETAKRRGLDMVVVPIDGASASSSNRPAVAGYYNEAFGGLPAVALVREAETNFNGYANWNPIGGNEVVAIWNKEEKG